MGRSWAEMSYSNDLYITCIISSRQMMGHRRLVPTLLIVSARLGSSTLNFKAANLPRRIFGVARNAHTLWIPGESAAAALQ